MKFIEEQLSSLENQTVSSVDIFASDDGSTDGTWELLEERAGRWSKGAFVLMRGPQSGNPADNFRSLILRADDKYDFFAFCDQDDIWLPNKLERATSRLKTTDAGCAVYCSRTELATESGAPYGLSKYFRRPPDFRNALVQSLAGGNTMVMTKRAFELVRESSGRGPYVAHDWWVYLVVTGAGGQMIYSAEPDILYRQHGGNAVGSNIGILAGFRRLAMVGKGRFRAWNDINLDTLQRCRDLLTPSAVATLDLYVKARSGPVVQRLANLARSGVYRQTSRGQASLLAACVFNLL